LVSVWVLFVVLFAPSFFKQVDFEAAGVDELPFVRGDVVRVIKKSKDMYKGELQGISLSFSSFSLSVYVRL
jgi:SH3 domain